MLNDSVARFLETRGMLEDALNVATDPDYKFELAVQLGKLDVAKVILLYDLLSPSVSLLYLNRMEMYLEIELIILDYLSSLYHYGISSHFSLC